MSGALLEVSSLAADYGDVRALWDVSLRIEPGEIVALVGPNGAGKTTLMRCIAGLHRPASGAISFEDQATHQLPPHRIVEAGVILVPEGRKLFGAMSVYENLQLGAFSRRARPSLSATLEQVLTIFPILRERQRQSARTMSGGQQQMLAIGRALMGRPRLLLLDEPSLGLAPMVVRDIFAVIADINRQGMTVLLVEQNARLALELATRAYILEQGRVVGEGPAHQLLHDRQVQQAYLGYVEEEQPQQD